MILKPRLFRKPNLSHPRARGLVGCWLMNEGSGSIVQDLSGNGNTGALTGDELLWVGGTTGPAIYFGGTTDWISIGDKPTLEGMNQLSIVAKVRPVDASTQQWVIGKTNAYALEVYLDRIRYRIWGGGSEVAVFSNNPSIFDNTWHTIAGVYDGTAVKTFVDGVFHLSSAETGAIPSNSSPVGIGAYPSAPSILEFNGDIEYVYVYNRTLSTSEIVQLYREPFCMFDRDPIELWTGAMGGGAPPVGNAGIMTCNTGFWGATY